MFRHRLLPLAIAAALLASCQAAPPAGVATAQAVAGRGNVVIAPTFTGGGTRRLLAAVTAYTEASIDHMDVELFTVVSAVETTTGQKVAIPQASLYNAFTFSNLNFDTTYRAKATAYDAAGTVISEAASVDITVARDDRPVMGNLVVQLKDRVFAGEATSGGTTITAGQVTHAGTEDGEVAGTLYFNLVDTLAALGGAHAPAAVLATDDGWIYYTDTSDGTLYKVPDTGGAPSAVAVGLDAPRALARAADGTLYVADDRRVYRVGSGGILYAVAGQTGAAGNNPPAGGGAVPGGDAQLVDVRGLACEPDGDLLILDAGNDVVRRLTTGGSLENVTDQATLVDGRGLVRGRDGRFYVADAGSAVIWKLDPANGNLSVFAGNGDTDGLDGTATGGSFGTLSGGLAFDRAGWLYVGDGSAVRRIDPGGKRLDTLAGHASETGSGNGSLGTARFTQVRGLAITRDGAAVVSDGAQLRRIYQFSL